MPSAFSITFGVLPSMTATHELVVPRSMPMTLPMVRPLNLRQAGRAARRPSRECQRLIRRPPVQPPGYAIRRIFAAYGSYRRGVGGCKSCDHEIARIRRQSRINGYRPIAACGGGGGARRRRLRFLEDLRA